MLFFGGESLEPSRFNAEFGALLPAQWGAVNASDAEVPWRIGAYERSSPVFRPFAPARSGSPAVAEFTHRHAVTLAQAPPARQSSHQPQASTQVPRVFLSAQVLTKMLLATTAAQAAHPASPWTPWHPPFLPLHSAVQPVFSIPI